jgi:hypothetical protein
VRRTIFALLLATLALGGLRAQEAVPAPVNENTVMPPAKEAPAKPRATPPAAAALFRNPAAWITPATHIALVNHGDAVDAAWLTELAATLQRELRLPVRAIPSTAADPADAFALATQVRAELSADAKVFVVLTKLAMDPVLASPQKGWSVMNVDWVTKFPADADKLRERMGKQVYRALGFALGAGLRTEPQAVMRAALNAPDLDLAVSHNYHPQNLSIVLTMAKAFGVETIRMKPRAELEALGLLPPRPATVAEPAAAEKTPAAPDKNAKPSIP